MQFDPVALRTTNVAVDPNGATNPVLTANGLVVCSPSATNFTVFDPIIKTSYTYTNPTYGASGVLMPSGNVLFIPQTSGSNVVTFSPTTYTLSNLSFAGGSYSSGTLLPNGQVVMGPVGTANVSVLSTAVPTTREFCLSPYVNKF